MITGRKMVRKKKKKRPVTIGSRYINNLYVDKKMTPKQYYGSLEKETVACPVCGASDSRQLGSDDRYGMGVTSCGCDRCGLIFINPRPTKKELDAFYSGVYRTYYESIEKPTEEYVKAGPYQDRAAYVVDKLKKVVDVNLDPKVLDIGCAEGTLLKTIKNEYPRAQLFGLEPDSNFAQYARNNTNATIGVGDFQTLQNEEVYRDFDLVTVTHVLEHILDPKEFLMMIGSIMKPGAHLYVEVPNINDDRAIGIDNVHIGHVLYLSPPNFRYLLATSGFEIIEEYVGDLPAKTFSMACLVRKTTGKPDRVHLDSSGVSQIHDKFKKNIVAVCVAEAAGGSFLRKMFNRLVKHF